jgi:hypothetical protein
LLGISGPVAAGIEVKEEAFELDSGFSRAGRTGCRPDLPVRGTGGRGSALVFKEFKECKNCIMQKVHLG